MHEQLIKQSVSNTYLFLNHLYNEQPNSGDVAHRNLFLNHLNDE